MKTHEVHVGKVYAARVSGKLAPVYLLRESHYGGWDGRNEVTKYPVRIRSAARLRFEVAWDETTGHWERVDT